MMPRFFEVNSVTRPAKDNTHFSFREFVFGGAHGSGFSL